MPRPAPPRILILSLSLCAAFLAGTIAAPALHAGRFNPYAKLGVFAKVLSYIETNYVEDVAEQDLMFGAAGGLVSVLDPHSKFMDPQEYAQLKRETEGNEEFTGIGIDVEKLGGRLIVVSPIEGSPAHKAGLLPGDVIKRINGTDAANFNDLDDALREIQGPAGTEVSLVVDRKGRELFFRLRRDKFEVKPVEWKELDDGYGYLKVRFFSATTDGMLTEALDKLEARAGGLHGLVLDLRHNPGGLLDQGVKVADEFIDKGNIVTTRGKGGQIVDEAKAHSRGTHAGFPLIALVDAGTASAAEIVAGALQDHGRGVIMGTQTFGKGSVQTVIDLDGCGAKPCGLKITVARYYTPSGRSIQGQGITPDVVVPAVAPPPDPAEEARFREKNYKNRLNNEQGESGPAHKRQDDYQLQMALDYLRSWSVFNKTAKK